MFVPRIVARPPTSAVVGRKITPARLAAAVLFKLASLTRELRPTVCAAAETLSLSVWVVFVFPAARDVRPGAGAVPDPPVTTRDIVAARDAVVGADTTAEVDSVPVDATGRRDATVVRADVDVCSVELVTVFSAALVRPVGKAREIVTASSATLGKIPNRI